MRRRGDCSEKGGIVYSEKEGELYIVRRRGNCSEEEGIVVRKGL